jgi:hypothetical protein
VEEEKRGAIRVEGKSRQESNFVHAAHHFGRKDVIDSAPTPLTPTAWLRMRRSVMYRKSLAIFSLGFVPYEKIQNVTQSIICGRKNSICLAMHAI